jgi:hypothetical protein
MTRAILLFGVLLAGCAGHVDAQAAACASSCEVAGGEVKASVAAQDRRIEVVLRSDDPGAARTEQRMWAAR